METRISRQHLSITTHEGAAQQDRNFWAKASADERLLAVELQRKIAYGYEIGPRLQRLLEVTWRTAR